MSKSAHLSISPNIYPSLPPSTTTTNLRRVPLVFPERASIAAARYQYLPPAPPALALAAAANNHRDRNNTSGGTGIAGGYINGSMSLITPDPSPVVSSFAPSSYATGTGTGTGRNEGYGMGL